MLCAPCISAEVSQIIVLLLKVASNGCIVNEGKTICFIFLITCSFCEQGVMERLHCVLLSVPFKTNSQSCYSLFVFRSSQGAPDWSCVIAGFSSGYVRIYLQVSVPEI